MLLTGPCFNTEIEEIICLFTDHNGDVTTFTNSGGNVISRSITGIIVSEQAVCPMPLFRSLGNHTVTITLNNNASYSGSFDVGTYRCKLRSMLI